MYYWRLCHLSPSTAPKSHERAQICCLVSLSTGLVQVVSFLSSSFYGDCWEEGLTLFLHCVLHLWQKQNEPTGQPAGPYQPLPGGLACSNFSSAISLASVALSLTVSIRPA